MTHLTTKFERLIAAVLLSVAATLSSSPAQAQCNGGPTSPCGSSNTSASTSSTSVGAGNPINLATGNKYQEEVDLAPLPGVLGLEIVRHYNSAYAGAQHAPGLVGRGWRLSYEAFLQLGREGGATGADTPRAVLTVSQADGSEVGLRRSERDANVYVAQDRSLGKLEVKEEANRAKTTYVWHWPATAERLGRQLTFNAHGKLTRMQQADGHAVSLEYEEAGMRRLTSVTDASGRRMTLQYPARFSPNEFQGVQHIDTPVGRYSYRYTEGRQRAQIANISSVTQPDGSRREYHHEAAKQPLLLTGISVREAPSTTSTPTSSTLPSLTRISSYAYDELGQAIASVRGVMPATVMQVTEGKPLTQAEAESSPEFVRVTKFVPPSSLKEGVTEIVNGVGQRTRYTTALIGGQARLTGSLGPGCAQCPPVNTKWGYDEQGVLTTTTATDEQGRGLYAQVRTLDAQGRVVAIQERWFVTEAGKNNKLSKIAATRLKERAAYEGESRQPSLIARPSVVAAGKEHVIRMAYNAMGQLQSMTEEGYSPIDERGEPKSSPIKRTTNYAYTSTQGKSLLTAIDGPLPNGAKQTPEDSDITVMAWDNQGNTVVAVTAPMNQMTRYTHDEAGRIRWANHPNATDTHWHYARSEARRPSAIVRAGVAKGFAYDAQGRVGAVADASGRYITLHYDTANRLHTVRDAQGFTQTIQRDAEGKVLRAGMHEPNQDKPMRAAYRFYDEQQRLKASLLPDGRLSTWRYDDTPQGRGRLVEHIDGDDVWSQWRYGSQGASEVVSRLDLTPDGLARMSVSEMGLVRGGVFGAPSQEARLPVAEVKSSRSTEQHATRMTSLNPTIPTQAAILASNPTTAVRDDFDRTVAQWTPDHGSRFIVHDAGGRVVLQRRLGTDARLVQTIEQDHDVAGRLTERRIKDSTNALQETVRLAWEGPQLRLIEDGAQVQAFEYEQGRTLTTTTTIKTPEGKLLAPIKLITRYNPLTGEPNSHGLADGRELHIERDKERDAARGTNSGVIKSMTLKAAASWWQPWKPGWRFSALFEGNLHDDRIVLEDVAAHPFNGLTRWRHGNGVQTTKGFDLAGRQTSLNTGAPKVPIHAQSIGYEVGPRVRVIKDQATSQSSRFEYDGFGRLMNPAAPKFQRTTFSSTGNQSPSSTSISAQTDASRAKGSIDTLGRVASDETYRYSYDANGQLAEVHTHQAQGNRLVARYRYNSAWQRVSKTVFAASDSSTTYFLWYRGALVAEFTEKAGRPRIDVQYLYLREGNRSTPIAKLETARADGNTSGKARMLAVHADHRGQPIAMSDERQSIVWRSQVTVHDNAWGQMRIGVHAPTHERSNNLPDPQQTVMNLSLPGQYRDAETGLHDNWHRSYDPSTGRYLQPDPLGYPDGHDPYSYVNGDPVNKIDPTGLYEEDVHYYMTLFLALAAGLSLEDAKITALAAQYIDDNPLTRPLDSTSVGTTLASMFRNHQQLLLYHFTLANPQGATLTQYNNSNVNSVVGNLSPQLNNLRNAALRAPQRCTRFQFLGEFIHAYADTFGHRNEGNLPYDAIRLGVGLGHGLAGHEPDYTYNAGLWTVREARALSMERAVYQQLRGFPGGPGVTRGAGVEFSSIESTLTTFNAIQESGLNATRKIRLLQDEINRMISNSLIALRSPQGEAVSSVDLTRSFLFDNGAVGLRYNEDLARTNRNNYLSGHGLTEFDYPGICLAHGTRCRPL